MGPGLRDRGGIVGDRRLQVLAERGIEFDWARRFVAQVPRGELCFLPGVGHSPMADDPEVVSEVILSFAGRASS